MAGCGMGEELEGFGQIAIILQVPSRCGGDGHSCVQELWPAEQQTLSQASGDVETEGT